WRKLLDFSENAGVYDVAQRLLDLLTLRVARSWMEPCGFEDQADMIEAVLVILWGRKALVLHEHELRQRRGALDPGDMVYLRCLMRKYGWERRSNADSPCLWQEVFPKADYVAFAWFLLQELLHPRSATELTTLRELHQPAAVAAERGASIPMFFACMKNYGNGRMKTKAYPPDVEFISALHIDCLQSGDDFQAPSMSTQRGIIANADSRLREPGGPEQDRHESACAVCARRHWEEDLKPLLLFRDPCADELAQDVDHDCDKVHISQQSRLCRLLGVQRYAHRWPHIDVDELKASAVEHPFLKDEFLLLHKRRMPVDVTQPCDVCRDCRAALLSSVLTLPRFSLANDLWMGRQMQPLRNLAAGTRRLLPMIRACLQVTVLQPANLQKEERQRGFVGNSIFLPQAQPSAIRTTLPPPESDMQESILFVLVGQKKDTLASSALLSCPRDEYDAAVSCLQRSSPYYRNVELRRCSESPMQGCFVETSEDSYLARELLQKGPADAQGQDEESEKDETTQPAAHGSEHSAAEEDAGHMLSTVVGLNDGADEQNKWVRVVRDLEELCERRPGDRRSHAEELVRNRSNNDMDGQVPDGDRQLLGREGAHERRTINQIRRVQSLARGTAESERRAEASMFHVRPSKLVVPSGAEPASMFEPSTWAMAYPDLFPWGDGVPFLRRDTALDAPEVFRYLLLREELHYILCEDEAAARPMLPRWSLSESLLPVMYDVSRRLHLMRATKAHVQRRGFGKHCKLIAGVSVEHLLKAMALHGESADVRKLLQDDAVDLPLKRALGGVLQATASIIGMEGHRSQIRFRSHAAGWHYGTPHLFVTPNLADVRSPLLLQLHLQNDGVAEVEEFAIALDWSQEGKVDAPEATVHDGDARDAEMGKDDADEEEFAPVPETLDPFLVDLNARGLGPAEYALELAKGSAVEAQIAQVLVLPRLAFRTTRLVVGSS
ncbi:unnamed protein product, partial [Effrenium voratum]